MVSLFRSTSAKCGPICRDVQAEVDSIKRDTALRALMEKRANDREQR